MCCFIFLSDDLQISMSVVVVLTTVHIIVITMLAHSPAHVILATDSPAMEEVAMVG